MSAAAADPLLACGNCRQPMQRLSLDAHYGTRVDLDLCRSCDLVWFDGTETARLAGTGLLALIGAMAEACGLPFESLRAACVCPRCAGPLRTVHNQSRWGRTLQLQCLKRDGAYQTFAQFLEEKGLLRPMSRVDRDRLLGTKGRIDCVNCGAAVGVDDALCPFCRSVPSLLDVARLARALDPEGALPPHAVFATPARQEAMQCAACGVALPPGGAISCPQCHATLAIADLAEAYGAVEALAEQLKQVAAKPPPELVKRRIDALDADLPRQRDYIDSFAPGEDSRFNGSGSWTFGQRSGRLDPNTWGLRLVIGIGFAVWLLLQLLPPLRRPNDPSSLQSRPHVVKQLCLPGAACRAASAP